MGMLLQQVTEMGCHHRAGIDHRISLGLRIVALTGFDPHRVQTKRRITGLDPLDLTKHLARIDGHLLVDVDFRFTHRHTQQVDAVGSRLQIEVVADMHRVNQETKLLRKFLAHPLDTRHQLTACFLSTSGIRR